MSSKNRNSPIKLEYACNEEKENTLVQLPPKVGEKGKKEKYKRLKRIQNYAQ